MLSDTSITLEHVAKAAGVSPKTVSRVLNNEGNVREDTRDRVLKAIDELGYRPNAAARSLASNRSYLVAHLHNNPNRDYLFRINEGAYAACKSSSHYLLTERVDHRSANLIDQVRDILLRTHVDAVLLSPPLSDHAELVGFLQAQPVALGLLSPVSHDTTIVAADINNVKAGAAVAEDLLEAGHTRFGLIGGPDGHGSAVGRCDGFHGYLIEAGFTEGDIIRIDGDFSFKSGLDAAATIFDASKRPTAIFAANDDMAAGAMNAALKLGLSVPEDVSIVGFDGSQLADQIWPRLTTVRQPVSRMSKWLVERLIAKGQGIANEDTIFAQFDFTLQKGGSTRSSQPQD